MKSPASRSERSTWVSAAKLTIASQPFGRFGDHRAVADVAVHEACASTPSQVREVARVGQLVEDDDVFAGGREPLDEVRADEAGAAGDQDRHSAEA